MFYEGAPGTSLGNADFSLPFQLYLGAKKVGDLCFTILTLKTSNSSKEDKAKTIFNIPELNQRLLCDSLVVIIFLSCKSQLNPEEPN